jgi:hypothetical protein
MTLFSEILNGNRKKGVILLRKKFSFKGVSSFVYWFLYVRAFECSNKSM